MLHRTYAECGIILDETHKADLVYFLLKRADDYPGIEDWAQEICRTINPAAKPYFRPPDYRNR